MSSPEAMAYKLPVFGSLQPDTISLSVPVDKGAVQFGNPLSNPTERLTVTVLEAPEIHIVREDTTPLQIEEVIFDAATWTRRSLSALAAPVGKLILRPGETEQLWSAAGTDGLKLASPEAFEHFLSWVSVSALRHQGRQNKGQAPTWAELLKRLDN